MYKNLLALVSNQKHQGTEGGDPSEVCGGGGGIKAKSIKEEIFSLLSWHAYTFLNN